MSDAPTIHHGIGYSIRSLGHSEWLWEIHPPIETVKGLEPASGKISGNSGDAIEAARKAIDRQAVQSGCAIH